MEARVLAADEAQEIAMLRHLCHLVDALVIVEHFLHFHDLPVLLDRVQHPNLVQHLLVLQLCLNLELLDQLDRVHAAAAYLNRLVHDAKTALTDNCTDNIVLI